MAENTPSENPNGPSQSQAAPPPAGTIEIAGQKYTEEDLKKALSGIQEVEEARREAQADYTRKTQDISRKRREVEEMEAKAKSLLEKAERELNYSSTEADPAFESALTPLRQELHQLAEIVKEDRQTRLSREQDAQLRENRAAAVRSLKGRPFINDDTMSEMQSFMERNNLAPEHVALAYNAMFGAQIGELKGRQRAIAEGTAAGPPLVGAGSTRISPGFTTPTEAPGTEFSVERMSWDDVKAAAMGSQDKPAF